MAAIIDGKEISRQMREEIACEVAALQAEHGITPGPAVVLVGEDAASEIYVRMKTHVCHQVGIRSRTVRLAAETSRNELFAAIDRLNADAAVHGILVQLPLPAHLPDKVVLNRIDPRKDVDGFHPLNAGLAFVGEPTGFVPCTPAGILELLRREEVPTRGRHVVIVGRSLIVSKPLMSLLMAPGPDATVTLTHKHTVHPASHTRMADILMVAVGKPGLITADLVKPGATVIDVGVSRVPEPTRPRGYRIVGDVDFEGVSGVAGAITPVPGGVGPMTITMLLSNTLAAARKDGKRVS